MPRDACRGAARPDASSPTLPTTHGGVSIDPIRTLPLGIALLILATGAVGLLFVFAGHRLLGAALAVVGAAIGALLGLAVAEVVVTAAPGWALGAGGAVVGAVLGALCSRLAAAAILAGILAVAGVLGVGSAERHGWIGFASARGSADALPDAGDHDTLDTASVPASLALAAQESVVSALRRDVSGRVERLSAPLHAPAVEANLGALRGLVAEGWESLRARWTTSPRPVRTLMLACAAMCGFLGLGLGLIASRWTAAFVTALAGALMVIFSVAAGAQQLFGDPSALPGSRSGWILAWGLLALCGTAVQWGTQPAAGHAA